jgi:hypothetical protein
MSSAYANASNANREMCSSDTWSRVATRQICYYQSSREYLNRGQVGYYTLYPVCAAELGRLKYSLEQVPFFCRVPETAHWGKPSGVFDGHDRFGTSLFPQFVLFLLRDIILRRPKGRMVLSKVPSFSKKATSVVFPPMVL